MAKPHFNRSHFDKNKMLIFSVVDSIFQEYVFLFKKQEKIKNKEKISKRAALHSDLIFCILQITECYEELSERTSDLSIRELLLKQRVEQLTKENELLRQGI